MTALLLPFADGFGAFLVGAGGQHRDPRVHQFVARRDGPDPDGDHPRGNRVGVGDRVGRRAAGGQIAFAERVRERVGFGVGTREKQDAVAARKEGTDLLAKHLKPPGVGDGAAAAEAEQPREPRRADPAAEGVDVNRDRRRKKSVERGGGRGGDRVFSDHQPGVQKVFQRFEHEGGLPLEALAHLARPGEKDHGMPLPRQKIGKGRRVGTDERQIFVKEGKIGPALQRRQFGGVDLAGVEFGVGVGVGGKGLALPRAGRNGEFREFRLYHLAHLSERLGGRQDLAGGQQREGFRNRFGDPLGQGVETANPIDLVAEEIEAQGGGFPARKDVDDPAAPGELPRALDGVDPTVAVLRKNIGEDVGREDRAGAENRSASGEPFGGNRRLQGGEGGGDDGVELARERAVQHRKPLTFKIVRGGHMMQAELARGIDGGAKPGVREQRRDPDRFTLVPCENEGGTVRGVGAVIPDRLGKEGVRRPAGQTVDDDRERRFRRDRLRERERRPPELPVQTDRIGDLLHGSSLYLNGNSGSSLGRSRPRRSGSRRRKSRRRGR